MIDPRDSEAISANFERWGFSRVIVELEPSGELETTGRLPIQRDPALEQRRRRAIKRAQGRMLAQLTRVGRVQRFRNIPALAMKVTPEELAEIQRLKEVRAIREDLLLRPMLDDSLGQIGADAAHASGYLGQGKVVAVLDTGVDALHPAFSGRVLAEACFSTTGGPASSVCPDGTTSQVGVGAARPCLVGSECTHGTHVAGIALGSDDVYRGVAPGAGLIAIQVFSRFDDSNICGGASSCVLTYYSDVLAALDWLYTRLDLYDLVSINLSLGGGRYPSGCDSVYPALADMISALRADGVALVAASGNNGYADAMALPACMGDAISVGAVTSVDSVAGYSNGSPGLSLLAPGSGIRSAVPGNGFGSKSGTSMAAPHVAGAFAVLASAVDYEVIDELLTGLLDSGQPVVDSRSGIATPRIQLDDALDLLLGAGAEAPLENGPDISLSIGVLESGAYGYQYGSDEHGTALGVRFQSTGRDLELAVTGYDIDSPGEVVVYLNDAPIGNLSAGANDSLAAPDLFNLTADRQSVGENRILFSQQVPGETWGVTSLQLRDIGSEPEPPLPEGTIRLQLNELDAGRYGNNFGDIAGLTALDVLFGNSGSDLELEVTGFDVVSNEKIAVYLNGALFGWLGKGPAAALNEGDIFVIPAELLSAGDNQLTFSVRVPSWTWGVTGLVLREADSTPLND